MAAKGTLRVRIVGDAAPLKKTLGGLGRNVAKFGAVAAAAGGVAAVGFVKLAGHAATLEAQARKSGAVFEDQLPVVQKWARQSAGAMGLTSAELTSLSANFADLLKPMGFTAEQAAKMSMETNNLAGALAEWSGGQYDAAGASEILAKAMLGERESLKSLGISITEADVQARLAAKGQKELTGAALQQAKAIATQELIMEKSTDAQKAYEEGSGSLQRKQSQLTATIKELRDRGLQAMLPIAHRVAEWASVMLPKGIAVATDAFNNHLKPALQVVSAWWDTNGLAIIALGKGIAKVVGATLKTAFDAVVNVFKFVNRNSEIMIPLLGGILAGFVAFKTIVTVIKAIQFATAAWTAVQAALNVVLTANPIGIVIVAVAALVAGIVIAYKRSETFRNIVDGAFRAVGAAVSGVIDWFRSLGQWVTGTVDDFKRGWDRIVGTVTGLPNRIRTAARGMWDGITEAFKGAINAIIRGWNRIEFRVPGFKVGPISYGGFALGLPDIPQLEQGGEVLKTGLAMVHRGEKFSGTRGQYPIGGGGVTVNLTVQGSVVTERDLLATLQEGARAYERRNGRSGF